MPPAGKYRHRVSIQAATYAKNAANEDVPTWATLQTLWAEVKALSGAEPLIADQTVATTQYQVTHRYYAGLTAQHRYLWGDRVLEISGVPHDVMKVEHVSLCTHRQDAVPSGVEAASTGFWGSGHWGA